MIDDHFSNTPPGVTPARLTRTLLFLQNQTHAAMKVLESQSAILSNYEVYQHVVDQTKQYKKARRRGPPNYETVVHEVSHSNCIVFPSQRG